jgi:hypothetical protein
MQLRAVTLTLLFAFGCSGGPPAAPEERTEQKGPLMRIDWGWILPTGTYVFSDTEEDSVETIVIDPSGKMSFTIDRPGEDNDETLTGGWEQTYDGVRLDYRNVNGKRSESQAFFKYDEARGAIIPKEGEAKSYTLVKSKSESE